MKTRRWVSGTVLRGTLAAILAMAVTAGCDRASRAPANDTAGRADSPLADSGFAEDRNPGWDERDGPVLFIAGATPEEAHVILPAAVDADGVPLPGIAGDITTLTRDGRLARVNMLRVTPHTDSQCVAWPKAIVRDSAGAAPRPWMVGFANSGLAAVSMDSVEAMSRGDSTRLASEIARLASALPDDSVASFRGLPFVVREMRRFRPAPEVEAVVTDVARRLATEANPREERLFLIAERRGGQWRAVYWSRASGAEDAVESGDALATVRFADGRVGMVVALETGSTMRFAIVQRGANDRWTVRWRSAETDC